MFTRSKQPEPYKPDTSRKEWASRAARIGELYGELLPIIQDIQEKKPELNPFHDGKGHAQAVAESNGFMRLMDLVPNVQGNVVKMGPCAEGGVPAAQFHRITKELCAAPKKDTPTIFMQVNALLKQHLPDGEEKKQALRISDDLEWALNETYLAAETKRAGKKAER